MQRERWFCAQLTRRRIMTAAAVGGLAVSARPASAQRCPVTPPQRPKDPLRWMDMDQQELDDAYDNDVYAFNAKNVLERQRINNEVATAIVGKPMQVAYGQSEIEKIDIYKARVSKSTRDGIYSRRQLAFRPLRHFAVYAEPFVKAGADFVAVDFASVRETNGDLFRWWTSAARCGLGLPERLSLRREIRTPCTSAAAPPAAILPVASSLPGGKTGPAAQYSQGCGVRQRHV